MTTRKKRGGPAEKKWAYRSYEPLDLPAGTYKIWIFAGDRLGPGYSPGKSACAYEIRDEQDLLVESPDPLVTEHAHSSQWRGYIAASTRGLERVPKQSTAIICSHHGGFLRHIEAIDGYRANGWRNKSEGMIADVDIWERFILARDGENNCLRGITVSTSEVASDHEIIERLKLKVNNVLDVATASRRKN